MKNKNPLYKFVFGTRCCTNCKQQKPNHNGSYRIFNNGKNQEWICADCNTVS